MATPVPFVELPPEIRNHIYELVVGQRRFVRIKLSSFAPHNNTKPFASASALMATCQQVHDEFTSVLVEYGLTTARALIAPVTDFDFNELETFIRRLTPSQTAKLQAAANPKRIVAQMSISSTASTTLPRPSLENWLNFCTTHNIPIAYDVTQLDGGSYFPRKYRDYYGSWITICFFYFRGNSNSAKAKRTNPAEFAKIGFSFKFWLLRPNERAEYLRNRGLQNRDVSPLLVTYRRKVPEAPWKGVHVPSRTGRR